MAFHNNPFPFTLAALGAAPGWAVDVVELGGGSEQRIGLAGDARRRYNAGTAISKVSDFDDIVHHFNGRRSMLHSFPIKDVTLYRATLEPIGTGGGVGSTNQLTINEGDAGNAYNMEVYLPISGTVQIFAGVTLKTEGVHYTLAYTGATGGLVTWLQSVSGQALSWTGEFYIPVRYDIEQLPEADVFAYLGGTQYLRRPANIPLIEVRYPAEFA
jgi:uncharacterized protein (TIGR02217 family)